MPTDPPSRIDLSAELGRSTEDYRETWQAVDAELYELCRRRSGQRSFADVYTKVAMIGRVYAAGISRSSRAAGDREAEVTRGLMAMDDLIEQQIEDLAGRQFDRGSAVQIIELHARVARGLLPYTGETWLQSFVAKYLHFHCDLVPILDNQAEGAIGKFVDWQVVASVRSSIGRPADWLRRYYNFATAFITLHERIDAETSIRVTVKEVDHLLWQAP